MKYSPGRKPWEKDDKGLFPSPSGKGSGWGSLKGGEFIHFLQGKQLQSFDPAVDFFGNATGVATPYSHSIPTGLDAGGCLPASPN